MERSERTTDKLRGLVRDLDEKLEGATSQPVIDLRASQLPFDDIVTDLDKKLQDRPAYQEPEIIPPRFSERVPTWLGFCMVTLLGIGIAVVAVRPWQHRCSYNNDLCQIAQLDIDALRIAIPESDLMATLPNIDALDPNDELTAGDIFAMERFADVNFEELITQEEIDRLLGASD